MTTTATEFLTISAEARVRVPTRLGGDWEIKHRRVYRDEDGSFYFRFGKRGTAKVRVAKVERVMGYRVAVSARMEDK